MLPAVRTLRPMAENQETADLLRAIGRAIEEQARATRYVIAVGFVVVTLVLLLT